MASLDSLGLLKTPLKLYFIIEYAIDSILKYIFHRLAGGSVKTRLEKFQDLSSVKNLLSHRRNSRLAVFVGFHAKNYLPLSNIEYLEALKKAGFLILYIHNGNLDISIKKQLSDLGAILICRSNIGFDVGAWKDSYLFLKSEGFLDNIEWLLFCNDSNHFLGGNKAEIFTRRFITYLDSGSHQLIALNKSYEICQHYQSFFLCMRKGIFLSGDFYRFWKNYLPLDHRFHAVNKCEIGLTNQVLSKYPSLIMYDSGQLYSSIISRKDIFAEEFLSLLPKNAMYLSSCVKDAQIYEFQLQRILAILDYHNPSHAFALLFVEFLDSPFLKKDLVRQGSYSISQLQSAIGRSVALNDNQSLVNEIVDFYLKGGLNSSYLRLPRQAYRKGINALHGVGFDGSGNILKNMGVK